MGAIDMVRFYIIGMIVVIGIGAAIKTPSGHDHINKWNEMWVNFLFFIPGIFISGTIMVWLENLGPKWTYDLSGVTGLLIGVILWHFYVSWRRRVHKLD